jgi:hypothetical protein
MPVKSTLVPDAVTDVPLTMFVDTPCTATVPVPAGKVIVFVPATAGATNVIDPDVSPKTDTGGVLMPVVALKTIVII